MCLSFFHPCRRVDFEKSVCARSQRNSLQQKCRLILIVAVLVNCGCGETPEPAGQRSEDSQPVTPVSDAKGMSHASSEMTEEINTPEISVPVNAAAIGEVADDEGASESTGSATATQDEKSALATNAAKEDASPRLVNQVVEPTPEQLAQWTQPEFEQLHLLACRESSSIGFVSNLAAALDGRHFLLAGTKVTLWSVDAETPEHVFLEQADDRTIKSLAVSPDGKWFAAGDSEGTIRIWSISDRAELNSKELYSNDITQIAISPDSQGIATISYDAEITIWSAEQLQEKNRFKVETNGLKRIEYMTSELLVAAGERTTTWNVSTGMLERELSPGRYNVTMARSPDGSQFVFGRDETLQFWNVTDQKSESTLAGGFATEELIAFSADQKHLATANGSSVRLWDIASGRIVQIIDTFGWPIRGLSWMPKTNVLVIASENGRVRIWGTTKDGEALGLHPLHAAVAMPDQGSQEPATPTQLLQAIDFRTFPRLPNSDARVNDEFNVSYEAAVSPEEAQLFYCYQLGKTGWSEVVASAATPGLIRFQKDGFMTSVSFYEGAESKTSINVNFAGNYDVRWAPKFDAAPIELDFENEDTVMYHTKADLIQIETTLLHKMHDAGWTAYARLHASHNEQEDGRDLEFLRNGMTMRVTIGRSPADPTNFNIQYSRFLAANSIPIPPDSGFVELETATQPFLVATTAMDLVQTREFYDRELIAEGWLVREYGRNLKDDYNWLTYIRGQQDLTVGLQSLPTGRTLVRVGDELENSSWQLAKPTEPTATDTTQAGIEAADFPVLNESKSAKFDSIDKSIEFSMDAIPLLEVAELYTKEIESLGWKLEGSGIRADDYVFLTFVKEEVEIALRARISEGKSIVNIQGDGLLWTKELPGGRKVISYETWLRINHHPASLDLLDQYQTEMRSIAQAVPSAEKPE